MPVITPAYPAMCSTHNITRSTLEIVTRELKRGGDITDRILMKKASWKELFVKHTFFTQDFRYYLAIISASTTEEAQLKWKGLVQSKIRRLVINLESHPSIALARPFTKGFERIHRCHSEADADKVKNGSIQFQIKEVPTATTDLAHDPEVATNKQNAADGEKPVENGEATMIFTTTYYVGLEMREGKFT